MINKEMTDQSIAQELGKRIKQIRLSKFSGGITQAALAERAGVNRSTVVALEQGRGKLETLIPVLRALDALDQLDNIAPPLVISPLELAKRQGNKRVRASGKKPGLDKSNNQRSNQSNKQPKNDEADW